MFNIVTLVQSLMAFLAQTHQICHVVHPASFYVTTDSPFLVLEMVRINCRSVT